MRYRRRWSRILRISCRRPPTRPYATRRWRFAEMGNPGPQAILNLPYLRTVTATEREVPGEYRQNAADRSRYMVPSISSRALWRIDARRPLRPGAPVTPGAFMVGNDAFLAGISAIEEARGALAVIIYLRCGEAANKCGGPEFPTRPPLRPHVATSFSIYTLRIVCR